MTVSPKHAVIVGGGITGLATTSALLEQARAAGVPLVCTLIEAGTEWGGKIRTRRRDGFVLEAGPDSFLSQKPWGVALCEHLGLSDQLINTKTSDEKAAVYSRGRLRPLPEGLVVVVPSRLGPFLRSGLLSWTGMLRMGLDFVLPPSQLTGDESIAGFFRRRLGREAFDRVIEPLMAGIYAGDAEQISLCATFPKFRELERRHGSVLRGILAGRQAARQSERTTFVTLRDGLGTLVEALVARLRADGATLILGRRIQGFRARSAPTPGYDLRFDDGGAVSADAVILTTPAYVTADLIHSLSPAAADLLAMIPYASTATISLAYPTTDLGPGVKGYGFVVPRIEGRDLLAATWTSLKWPHRAPAGHTLVRCYLGGVGREHILAGDDDILIRFVRGELARIAGVRGEPLFAEVSRWTRAMPQYTLGHVERLEQMDVLLEPHRGLHLTGASYRGIGIPDCIRDAGETASKVVARFRAASH